MAFPLIKLIHAFAGLKEKKNRIEKEVKASTNAGNKEPHNLYLRATEALEELKQIEKLEEKRRSVEAKIKILKKEYERIIQMENKMLEMGSRSKPKNALS